MKSFNLKLALILAKLSSIAYDNTEIKTKLGSLNFSLVARLGNINGLSGYICGNSEFSVLVFQGTDIKEGKTIIADLKFWFAGGKKIGWAKGFHEAYSKLFHSFWAYVRDCQTPLYVTGHSLGGAIANIAALEFPKEYFEACYTFGAPRVCGPKGLKLSEDKSIFRLVHRNDFVPAMPPLIFGYIGIGKMIYISKEDSLFTGWKAYCLRAVSLVLPIATKSVFGLADYGLNHLLSRYIESLLVASYRAKNTRIGE